jgi:hypothetical protein
VVPYLYVHAAEEAFEYPSARAGKDAERLALRYLECVLVQCASLRLRGVDCDISFVTNARRQRNVVGRAGARLLAEIEDYGVEIREAEYRHRGWARVPMFFASYYVFDAIEAVGGEDRLWLLTDVDCVWVDAPRVFAASDAAGPAVASIQIVYPPDWDNIGYSPATLADLAQRLSGKQAAVEGWIGGEFLVATGPQLRELMHVATALEAEATRIGSPLNTEEQLLTLACALGRVRFANLNAVAGRIWTGPRHGAVNPSRPLELGLWHLPGEKGLAFRRTAQALLRGRDGPLRRDLADPEAVGRRFNVAGLARGRQLQDDAWIAAQRARSILTSALRR